MMKNGYKKPLILRVNDNMIQDPSLLAIGTTRGVDRGTQTNDDIRLLRLLTIQRMIWPTGISPLSHGTCVWTGAKETCAATCATMKWAASHGKITAFFNTKHAIGWLYKTLPLAASGLCAAAAIIRTSRSSSDSTGVPYITPFMWPHRKKSSSQVG
ncbi:hypothetical protein PR048_013511 [Dryococelus australis]|uniref:Uncharacterized protein n=1 Tax=Dryococelus australis TaxID=614101 RepID=A0ABQ9HSD9_9NEOP|nr:hypothetical protein PR048_013511 [Dryococelus australis]